MNSELVIKLLSMGVATSFITGVFSLIISIRNNKKLMQIEDKKERFQMDEKRYMLLNEFLGELEKIQFLYEKEGVIPEQSVKFLKDLFVDTIDIFESIQKMHNKKSYLLDNAISLTTTIKKIDESISKYVKKYQNSNGDDSDDMVVEMDKICMDIYELRNNYGLELRNNIEKILKRL